MNVSIRRASCSLVVLLGSATLLFAQAVQPAQPRTAQPRVQPGTATQPAQPGQPGRFAQPGQPAQPGRILQPGQAGQAGGQALEPSIITLLIIENNKEIALAQLGQQHSQNEDIKHFCQMIEKDHSNFVQKLQERSGAGGRAPRIGATPGAAQPGQAVREGGREAGSELREGAREAAGQAREGAAQGRDAARDVAGQAREGAAQARDAARDQTGQPREGATAQRELQQRQTGERITLAKPVIANQPGAQLLALHQEVAEACLESARKDAEKASAQEFDKHFMAAQLIAHKGMLDKLQVCERHVSPQTAQLLASAQETTRKHLEEAESICKQLDSQGSGGRGAATERRTERRESPERRPTDRQREEQ